MRDRLIKLYRDHWDRVLPLVRPRGPLSLPLLIDVPSEYLQQPRKLFVVGQETNGWGEDIPVDAPDAIERSMDGYNRFAMGINYKKGEFWRAVRRLEGLLGIAPGNVVWSNLNKCDENNRAPSPSRVLTLIEAFPVLPGEIEITAPDALVLFSGPNYDEQIKAIFPGCAFEAVDGSEARPRALARVVHERLPKATLRTYHPSYLNRAKKLDQFLPLISDALTRLRTA